jgi:hypothetical protein
MTNNKMINNKTLTSCNNTLTYNKTKNNKKTQTSHYIQIFFKHFHQTHTFHKPLTLKKKFKTPTISNKFH